MVFNFQEKLLRNYFVFCGVARAFLASNLQRHWLVPVPLFASLEFCPLPHLKTQIKTNEIRRLSTNLINFVNPLAAVLEQRGTGLSTLINFLTTHHIQNKYVYLLLFTFFTINVTTARL